MHSLTTLLGRPLWHQTVPLSSIELPVSKMIYFSPLTSICTIRGNPYPRMFVDFCKLLKTALKTLHLEVGCDTKHFLYVHFYCYPLLDRGRFYLQNS